MRRPNSSKRVEDNVLPLDTVDVVSTVAPKRVIFYSVIYRRVRSQKWMRLRRLYSPNGMRAEGDRQEREPAIGRRQGWRPAG